MEGSALDIILKVVKDLRGDMERRFDQVDTRLDGVDKRLNSIDNRLDKIDNHLINVETKLDHTMEEIANLR